jgi:hypothetical protein
MCEDTWPWPVLRIYPCICPNGLMRITRKLSKGTEALSWNVLHV